VGKKKGIAKQRGTYEGISIDYKTARKNFFGLQPHLKSGGDLPAMRASEVEIARLRLAETIHEEVTSIRATRVENRITYRILEEELTPEGYTFEIKPRSSRQPLTLGQLISLIDNAKIHDPDGNVENTGLVLPHWEYEFNEQQSEIESISACIAISSVFYKQLAAYYGQVFTEWASSKATSSGKN
jgi:hypothetical protein